MDFKTWSLQRDLPLANFIFRRPIKKEVLRSICCLFGFVIVAPLPPPRRKNNKIEINYVGFVVFLVSDDKRIFRRPRH